MVLHRTLLYTFIQIIEGSFCEVRSRGLWVLREVVKCSILIRSKIVALINLDTSI